MIGLRRELEAFFRCPRSMQVLILANMTYSLLLPVIEIFVAAYVLRNTRQVDKVFVYQLSLYTGNPIAFYLNGLLLRHVSAKHLYAAGMVLSGLVMMLLMRTGALTPPGIALMGLAMGLATGFFWANRFVLVLAATSDENRNYYFGVELFASTLAAVAVPAFVGWFLSRASHWIWLDNSVNRAYRLVAIAFFVVTLVSAAILELGRFRNLESGTLFSLRLHPAWRKMLQLAMLKGLAQGYILAAPAMLVLLFVGLEGTLGAVLAAGGVISACALYIVGRIAAPWHRNRIFSLALLLFFAGAMVNALLFNAAGVLVFVACLVLAKPLLDLGYNPIELSAVDFTAAIERRNQYFYLFSHECGLFLGRAAGCLLFLGIARWGSPTSALRFALPAVGLLQILSIPLAHALSRAVNPSCADQ